jgi:3-keto-5-aminohexanoate cleavage enzyme
LSRFLLAVRGVGLHPDCVICAFGTAETACLHHALDVGGKDRVGFENDPWMAEGLMAPDNATRVREISKRVANLGSEGADISKSNPGQS